MTVTVQEIHHQINTLSPENLEDLAKYLEFLRFKNDGTDSPVEAKNATLRVFKLRGILHGHEFSPALLTEARQEMWSKFYNPQ
jgi:hypothetical protein